MSLKSEALSTDVGPGSSGHPSPRIVVGVPPSDPPDSMEIETPPLVIETKSGRDIVSEAKLPRREIAEVVGQELEVEARKVDAPKVAAKPVRAPAPVTLPSMTKTIVGVKQIDKPAFDFDAPLALPPPPVFTPVVAAEPEVTKAVDEGWSTAPPPVVAPKIDAPDLTSTIVDATPPGREALFDLTATLVQGSPEPEPQPVRAPQPELAKTLAFGSAKHADPTTDRAIELRERKELRERLKAKRTGAQVAAAVVAPSTDPDEISVPPAGDIGVEDEKFFSEGDLSVHDPVVGAHVDEDAHYVADKAMRKSLPHVVQRRAKLAGYVKIAVAGAAFLCLAAVGSSAFRGKTKAPEKTAAITQVATEAPATPKAAEPTAAPVEPAQPAVAPPPAEPAVEAKPAEEEPTKAEEIAGDAKEELKKSRTALERRKLTEAIEAGERSVALDPTDGEAWLILGAAYQEKGNGVDARRCYTACMKQGKTGPRSECAKMLR